MKTFLVGYTGFVGSNLIMQNEFDGLYNSKNIKDAFNKNPDILVYCGVPAQKFIANKFPDKDMDIIKNAINNIKLINPKIIVLISTIDVYKNPVNVNEDTKITISENQSYGENRYYLENWVQENYNKYLIVRLPGLYGNNIKKNFIYDFINVIPSMLKDEKFNELCNKNNLIKDYYINQDNGFYKAKDDLNENSKKILQEYFKNIGFSALNFTDSRGVFQFYNLAYLWKHISLALDNNIRLLNLATEPIMISELYEYLTGNTFINEISDNVPYYNYKSKNCEIFDGKDGYIFDKEFILKDIKKFIEEVNNEGNKSNQEN